MKTATLIRFNPDKKQTLGYQTFDTGEKFFCLELPWLNNARGISCITAGEYDVIPWVSPTKGKCFKVVSIGMSEVQGRSDILQHIGNYHKDIKGCQIFGLGMADINHDGLHDVTSSGDALEMMMKIAPEGYRLTIIAI